METGAERLLDPICREIKAGQTPDEGARRGLEATCGLALQQDDLVGGAETWPTLASVRRKRSRNRGRGSA